MYNADSVANVYVENSGFPAIRCSAGIRVVDYN